MKEHYKEYFRGNLPHIWCSGCGNGIVMSAWARAMKELDLDKNKCVGVSGIGCSSRITGYLDMNTLHTAHGRALPFATGVKMANPEMDVFIFSGDGDCAAIGGNHFIHACRRDMDMTLIVFNNHIYGMTGGQFSPLTPMGKKSTTSPYGTVDRGFDLCALAIGAGASFVARGDIFHAKQLTDLILAAYKHKGFSVLEVMATCPISYGRRNKIPLPADMVNYLKEHTVSKARAEKLSADELKDKIVVGVLHQEEPIEYISAYNRLVEELQGGGE
ncbi:MAG: 2-oxoacid:ferredoxin oxidoreductase subunit beta [Clostridiales bacterium]|nr:2-oxoacid:ferredoxin oxidoreductase subunit beta [Clostridiales bacterium]